MESAIKTGDLKTLFIEHLGWDHNAGQYTVAVEGESIVLDRVAQKRGVQVLAHRTDRPRVQTERYIRSIQARLVALAHEHILWVSDPVVSVQVWAWALHDRDSGRLLPRLHPAFSETVPREFIEQIEALAFTLDEEESVTVLDVVDRMATAFDAPATQKIFFRGPGYARESDRLARKMRSGGEAEFHEFVVFHQQLAIWFAKRFGRVCRDHEDLVQVAAIGLMRAARSYNLDFGTAFSTYAFRVMQTECWRYLPYSCRLLGCVPHHMIQAGITLLARARAKLRAGDPARWASCVIEAGDELGLSRDQTEAIRQFLCPRRIHPASKARRARLAGPVTYTGTARTMYREPLAELLLTERFRVLMAALNALDEREQTIIRLRFGFDGEEETLETIGARFGVTRERVRQLESKALATLVNLLRRRSDRGRQRSVASSDAIGGEDAFEF